MENLPPYLSKVIVSAEEIENRIAELARQIDGEYSGVEQLVLIGILRGAFVFMADLTRQLQTPHVVDFMALMSYHKNVSGEVRILMDSRESIKDQHILIVEDIIDSGGTLNHLYHTIQEREPASLGACVLVRKKRQQHPLQIPVNFIGFEIPDVWVVGYGLDYDNRYRTLPYIAELSPDVYK
ncbi:MAG TPA: hypoxanthine phosphoribosyltransferase [Anaerolineales bacterium]|nr:hypoxanthine phosphoribosyltransferase [Anaerolineales bacterium]